jgi:hypothetical protein
MKKLNPKRRSEGIQKLDPGQFESIEGIEPVL